MNVYVHVHFFMSICATVCVFVCVRVSECVHMSVYLRLYEYVAVLKSTVVSYSVLDFVALSVLAKFLIRCFPYECFFHASCTFEHLYVVVFSETVQFCDITKRIPF